MTHHSFVSIYLQMIEMEKNLNGEDLNPKNIGLLYKISFIIYF